MNVASERRVSDISRLVRAKNAGPFRVTIDVFCRDAQAYETVRDRVTAARVAAVFHIDDDKVQRYELPTLAVLKFSLARPCVQGASEDRDMHGAQWAILIADLALDRATDQTRDRTMASSG